MNTKTKIFAVLIALVVMASLGSATLVNYLSNTVERDIEVTSPLEISEDLTVIDMVGGDTQCLTLDITNQANRNVCGMIEVAVTVDTGEGAEPFDCEGLLINGEMFGEDCESCGCGCFSENLCDGGVYYYPCVCFEAGTTPTFDAEIVAAPNLEPGTYTFSTVVTMCECEWGDYECDCEGEDMCCDFECGTGGCLCGDWD